MNIHCKNVSALGAYLVVAFSSLLVSSFATSQEDPPPELRKLLLETLLSSLHHDQLQQGVLPTYSPPWNGHAPFPLPTPTHGLVPGDIRFPVPTIAFPSGYPVHSTWPKRNYGRHSYGLLCCNQPPTRAPKAKRPRFMPDNRWRNLVLSAIAKSFRDQAQLHASSGSENVEQHQEQKRSSLPFLDALTGGEDERRFDRRGVTVVKGGVSGINTGYRRG